MTLRPYQSDVIDSARLALTTSNSVVIQMPTGAGKTKVATSMIMGETGIVWFVCHRQEIERQAAAAFEKAGIDFGVVSPRAEPDYTKRVQIISIGTMRNRMKELQSPCVVFWDECHHAAAKTWSSLIEELPDAKHIGLTATPERLDGRGLGKWFDALIVGPSTRTLIDDGYLSEFRYYAPSDPDLTSAKVLERDYKKSDISKIMNTPTLIGDAVREYKSKALGKRAVVFAASVDASKALVERFNAEGIPAAHIDGNASPCDRDAAVQSLASGEIKILSNVEVFTEGFDLPVIDAVILMRPTKSLALFLQMIGRALRLAEGKNEALIFDHAGLWLDHGWPDEEFPWGIHGGTRTKRLESHAMHRTKLRRCPNCKEIYKSRNDECGCGYSFLKSRTIDVFEHHLQEIASMAPITIKAFSRLSNCTEEEILQWLSEGLPNDNGRVFTEIGLDWIRQHKRPNLPLKGHITKTDFCLRAGIKRTTLDRLIKAGMPCVDGNPHYAKGVNFMRENRDLVVPLRARAQSVPDGMMNCSQYGRRHGVSDNAVRKWIKAGAPSENGLIRVEDADAWLKVYQRTRHSPPAYRSLKLQQFHDSLRADNSASSAIAA